MSKIVPAELDAFCDHNLASSGLTKDPIGIGNLGNILTSSVSNFQYLQFEKDFSLFYELLIIQLPSPMATHFKALFPDANSFVVWNLQILMIHVLYLKGVSRGKLTSAFDDNIFVFKCLVDIMNMMKLNYKVPNPFGLFVDCDIYFDLYALNKDTCDRILEEANSIIAVSQKLHTIFNISQVDFVCSLVRLDPAAKRLNIFL
jgi:hypothetical protein